jgi:hypothetical protein
MSICVSYFLMAKSTVTQANKATCKRQGVRCDVEESRSRQTNWGSYENRNLKLRFQYRRHYAF